MTEESDWVMQDYELQSFSDQDWQAFLWRRSLQEPALRSSMSPLETQGLGSSQSAPVLVQQAVLPYDDPIACLPRKFGYTQEQADSLFNPNRRYPRCGDPQSATLSLQHK